MHARDLVELSALVAVHSPIMIHGRGRNAPGTQEQYWTAARCRLDRWTRLLGKLAGSAGELPRPATLSWARVRPVLEEILLSEVLTRVWAAVATAYDQSRGTAEIEPIARNVLTGHLEARRRVLQVLADCRVIEVADAVPLNQLRQRIERWTDVLLGHLAREVEIAEFAFDGQRAHDFADDLAQEAGAADPHFTCQLMLSSLQAALAHLEPTRSPNADLNRRVGSAILGCFREELFDSTGLVKSLWLERLAATAADTQGMIDELLRIDDVLQPSFPGSRLGTHFPEAPPRRQG